MACTSELADILSHLLWKLALLTCACLRRFPVLLSHVTDALCMLKSHCQFLTFFCSAWLCSGLIFAQRRATSEQSRLGKSSDQACWRNLVLRCRRKSYQLAELATIKCPLSCGSVSLSTYRHQNIENVTRCCILLLQLSNSRTRGFWPLCQSMSSHLDFLIWLNFTAVIILLIHLSFSSHF